MGTLYVKIISNKKNKSNEIDDITSWWRQSQMMWCVLLPLDHALMIIFG